MKYRYFILTITIYIRAFSLDAQSSLDSLLMDDDIDFSILSEDSLLLDQLDSLSIFALLDNLLNEDYKKSTLALRLGFTSDVVNAGRNLGINQEGLIPGISYFHSNGIFASVSGYWNSQSDPKYNLTVASVGYFGELGKKLTFSGSYEHSFYANSTSIEFESDQLTEEIADILDTSIEVESDNSLTSNASVGLIYDLDKVYISTDYSMFFGADIAHRWDWRITGNFRKKKFIGFDRVSLQPSFSVLMGNQGIIRSRFDERSFGDLEPIEQAQIIQAIIEELGYQATFRRATRDQRRQFIIDNNIIQLANQSISSITGVSQTFGVLNYSFSLPLTFRKGPWSYTMSYNYNIPVELPGEDLSLSSSGYLGLNLTYYISF